MSSIQVNITLTYSASVHTRKKHDCHPNTCRTIYTIDKLKMDSRLDSENLHSPLVSSGLICHRKVKHVTTVPPGVWYVASTSSTAYATQGCSCPLTAPRDTPSRTKTVISCQHTAKEHSPGQSWNHSVSPPSQESKPVPFLIWQLFPHPSSY